jgi:3-mercaptopyruvate sulfurtransferase SseA
VLLIADPARNYPGSGGAGMAEKVEELLAQARALLPRRPSPAEAFEAQAKGALLIDIRGDDQRRVRRRDQVIVLVCDEGFQSSLAAATLQRLGLRNATDMDGGFAAWRQAGLPVIPG